jgi:hypothetical protein
MKFPPPRCALAGAAPVPPQHLIGNFYYVGAMGVSSYLVAGAEREFRHELAAECAAK